MGNGAEKDNLSRIIKVLEEVKEGAFCSACVTEEMNIIEAAKLDSLELVNFLLLMEEEFEVEIDEHMTDTQEHAKIYSKCTFLLAQCQFLQENYKEGIELCVMGLKELREQGISYFMLPLLQSLTRYGEPFLERKAYREYCQYQSALENLRQEYGEDWRFSDSIFHACRQKEYYLDYELIRGERIAQGYTQEQLIQDVYGNPESLSRVESGKTAPSSKKFHQLMGKLNFEKTRYNTVLVTDSLDDLDIYSGITNYLNYEKYGQAEELLERLLQNIDLSSLENARFVSFVQRSIALSRGQTPSDGLLEEMRLHLHKTYRCEKNKAYRSPMVLEVFLLNQLAMALKQVDRKEEAAGLYRSGIEAMEQSKVSIKYRFSSYSLLLNNLGCMMNEEDFFRKSIKYELSCGTLKNVHKNQQRLAQLWLEQGKDREEGRRMLKLAFVLSKLALKETDAEEIKLTYEKWFGETLEKS